jgi:hypothetical protein
VLLFGEDIKTAGSLSLLVALPTKLVAFARYSRDGSFGGQVSANGSGSEIGGAGVVIVVPVPGDPPVASSAGYRVEWHHCSSRGSLCGSPECRGRHHSARGCPVLQVPGAVSAVFYGRRVLMGPLRSRLASSLARRERRCPVPPIFRHGGGPFRMEGRHPTASCSIDVSFTCNCKENWELPPVRASLRLRSMPS